MQISPARFFFAAQLLLLRYHSCHALHIRNGVDAENIYQCTPSVNGGPLGFPAQQKRLAIIIRGFFFGKQKLPLSPGKFTLKPYSWDFLSKSWPALRSNIIVPAEQQGVKVDVILGTYTSVKTGMPQGWWDQVLSAVKPEASYLFDEHLIGTQWKLSSELMRRWLRQKKYVYDTVLVTRADFVYQTNAWTILSHCYDPAAVNVQATMTPCRVGPKVNPKVWVDDMVHVMSGKTAWKMPDWILSFHTYYHAHRIGFHIGFDNLHLLSGRPMGKPDNCKPLLGHLDRGSNNWPPKQMCCDADWKIDLLSMNVSAKGGQGQSYRMFAPLTVHKWNGSFYRLPFVMATGIIVLLVAGLIVQWFTSRHVGVLACATSQPPLKTTSDDGATEVLVSKSPA